MDRPAASRSVAAGGETTLSSDVYGWHTFSEDVRDDSAGAARASNAIRRVEALAKYPERRLTLLLAPRFLRAFCRTNEIPAVAVS